MNPNSPWVNKWHQTLDGDKPLISSLLAGDYQGRPSSSPYVKSRPKAGGQQIVEDDPSGSVPLMDCLMQGRFFGERPNFRTESRPVSRMQEIDYTTQQPMVKSLMEGKFFIDKEAEKHRSVSRQNFIQKNRQMTKIYSGIYHAVAQQQQQQQKKGTDSRPASSMSVVRRSSPSPALLKTPRNAEELHHFTGGMIEDKNEKAVLSWLQHGSTKWQKDNFKKVFYSLQHNGSENLQQQQQQLNATAASSNSEQQKKKPKFVPPLPLYPSSAQIGNSSSTNNNNNHIDSNVQSALETVASLSRYLGRFRDEFRKEDSLHSGKLRKSKIIQVMMEISLPAGSVNSSVVDRDLLLERLNALANSCILDDPKAIDPHVSYPQLLKKLRLSTLPQMLKRPQ